VLADGRHARLAEFHQLLHAARCIVERRRLDLRVLDEKPPALRQRQPGASMPGESSLSSAPGTPISYAGPQQPFALHRDIVRQQQIVMLQHRPGSEFSIGITAASAAPSSTAANTSPESVHDKMVASGRAFAPLRG